VLVEPDGEESRGDEDSTVKLSVIKPAPKPTPVGVGAEGGPPEEDGEEPAGQEPDRPDAAPASE
jgi:hypothetical protein